MCMDPPLPRQWPGDAAHHFGHHGFEVPAFGNAVPVPAVGAGDEVVVAQCGANAHGNGFFADVEVRQSVHEAAGIDFPYLFFKTADAEHGAVHFDQDFRG